MHPTMSMPRVVIRLTFVFDDGVAVLCGTPGVDVAVKSSAFLLLVVWLPEASSIIGLWY